METPLVGLFARTRTAQDLVCNSHHHICTLEKEPTNTYDPNAIKVVLDGHTIGYIGKKVNKEYTQFSKCILNVQNFYKGEPICTLDNFV